MTLIPSISGTNAERSRVSNRQAVLGRIRSAGLMGRAEVARTLGLSTQAVSNIIADLQNDGLLIEAGTRSQGRGLPALQYGINAKGAYALGIEVRPDAIFTALVDLHGNAVATLRRTLKSNDPEYLVTMVLKLRAQMLEKTNIDAGKLLGAGIVIPGPFGQTGVSGLGSDLTGWQALDAHTLFENALELPVELSNDANASAMSEQIALGFNNFAYLYFGAGLGLGLVNQGQLVKGAFGNAGEIGHVKVMTPNGLLPLESQLSRVAFQKHMMSKKPIDISAIEKLFSQSDPKLMQWLEAGASVLSQALALIENLFDPQIVILGGAMPAPVLQHLITHTELPDLSVSNRADNPHPRLHIGTCGRMTATLGAASLILNRVFTPNATSL